MLLYLFLTCFPFLFFFKLKPVPPWPTELKFSFACILKLITNSLDITYFTPFPSRMSLKQMSFSSKVDSFEAVEGGGGGAISVLDLPDLALECIIERLPPASLCNMAGVCSSLRSMCTADHFWEKHMRNKWGRIIGPAAYREWQWHVALRKDSSHLKQGRPKGLMRILSMVRPSWWFKPKVDDDRSEQSSLPDDSIMSWFLALESGEFWFPAQVYNRENGHVGFMLSCYDAELSYDQRTDTFQARYPSHGRRAVAIENNVPWERLRAPPIDASLHNLHISDCLNELRPDDHIEIQWRRNKEFPYGWWYGVVGHLESCDRSENYCRCHQSDTVALEFNQYAPGSRWRHSMINRKEHREEGNEADGFYGGIRKLSRVEEISTWKRLWPSEILQ
ncbi:F-box protein [Hibiscus syriacus]|uniref:F-box protein n=1 Tax=Hibiscus syriacus TaxID=106335 RepID=A0A6A2YWJ6_HIBSY|nr:F-box protein At2g26850-like [Hibiscus syriacus]XP_039022962.1 F-box protein At2g26850-like [Hibiscus syriacus]KAE8683687.1 F-box protein [Hibiscus syriacus]